MTGGPAIVPGFRDLGLPDALLAALDRVGYETPSPIQTQAIPVLLAGHDLLGHAPTGTGKTAAFALPLIARIDVGLRSPQILTLTPTRELAIQVAEAYQQYASHVDGFHVLPIYGGQEYGGQIRQLKRGVQVVVGTPGRVMDHMRKGTLKLDRLQAVVLDEADEMLRMGFVEEVDWILEQTPERRQMALFSATMPKEVERIAKRHLREPRRISVEAKTATAETVRQRYWLVSGLHKLDALTRILEVEPINGVLVFVRTKTATTEVADRLDARGYAAAALNGDMQQKQREQAVDRLKRGSLDILVATDVAARGLDVDRVSHVVNYDIPYDAEAYIHRIGRTGRAGRTGEAILFVAPRERRMLAAIERATRQRIDLLDLPSAEAVNNKRIAAFKQRISDTLAAGDLAFMQSIVEQYQQEHDVPALEVAAALARMTLGDQPLLRTDPDAAGSSRAMPREAGDARPPRGDRTGREQGEGAFDRAPESGRRRPGDERQKTRAPAADRERFRLEVGRVHGVRPANIVGAIANEAGLDGHHIGPIEIDEEFTLVDLPVGMPREIFRDLKKVWVCGRQLMISRVDRTRTDRLPAAAVGNDRRSARPKPGARGPAAPSRGGGPRPPRGAARPKRKPNRP